MMKARGRPPHSDQLTPAEWRTVEAVRHGMSNPQIALRHGVSIDAVKFHVANVLAKLGFSGRAELRYWDGVRRDSVLHEKSMHIGEGDMIGRIGQIARSVKSIEQAKEWYKNTLGLPYLYSFGNLAFFDCGGVRLFLSEGDGASADSILYFHVDDVRVAHKALEAKGVEFLNAPHLIHRHDDGTEEWMAFFNDNEARPLALMSQHRAVG